MANESAHKLVFNIESSRPGVKGEVWHGGPFTVVRYHYDPGSRFPQHQHDPAQITIVLTGNIRFHIDNEDFDLGEGEAVYIPSGKTHSARVPTDGKAVESLNIFHPQRKEHP